MRDLLKKKSVKLMICASSVFSLLSACAKVNFSPVDSSTLSSVQPGVVGRLITSSTVIAPGNKQIDFLLILDDSDSMQTDLAKLAVRMESFINSLQSSDIDWQMCFVTTRGISTNGTVAFGNPRNWSSYTPAAGTPAYLLKKGTSNLNEIFTATVSNLQIGGGLSWDERAIMAAYQNFQNSSLLTANSSNPSSNDCYRKGSAISIISISNEDERSVGGDKTKLKPNDYALSYQPLEIGDIPENLITQSKTTFGDNARLTFNSIIVKPNDPTCEAQEDLDPSPSHPGVQYSKLSALTGGGVGSICDSDFSSTMNSFKSIVLNSISQMTLQCVPADGNVQVNINGKAITDFQLDGNILKFSSPLSEGTQVDLEYHCI